MIELLVGLLIVACITLWRVIVAKRHRWSRIRAEHKRRRRDSMMLLL